MQYSYQNPLETYKVNVIGTASLLEAIRSIQSVRVVVVITSDKCYENQEWFWGYRETDPLGGIDPYSSSKGCAEILVSSYRQSYFNSSTFKQHGVSIATARAGNVIGGGDWAQDRLIPDLIRSFRKKRTAIIRNPFAYRPWQYILDISHGYLLLAEKMWGKNDFSAAWNFGPHEDNIKPVSWIADEMTRLWGKKGNGNTQNKNILTKHVA